MVSALIANTSGGAYAPSSGIRSNYASSSMGGGPAGSGHITLGDWIGRVRCKRREMRRKNANLRVATVLAVTLRRAEADLRVRQQERATKWAELNQQISQAQVYPSSGAAAAAADDDSSAHSSFYHALQPAAAAAEQAQSSYYHQPNQQQLIFNESVQHQQHLQQQQQYYDPQHQQQQLQQAADDEIWRNELSDLDLFMQSLNQVKTCVVR